ncbi:MAG: phosphate/phosphite/phosphonate ABC transporter substrate-binding protein [Betaproteobacteria bacterium]|nr:phosphate/phosphite/phosphonate ABC transporter substrate-binding protein [Betaproteobacteria bacterium]
MARYIAFALAFLFALGSLRADADPRKSAPSSLTFGVVPQQSAGELASAWSPILDFLGKKSGVTLRFATAKDIPTFERRLADGEYDIAYMNPYHYTVFHRAPGYRAFAREKDKKLKGIIVVRKDSPYTDITHLRDGFIAFPGPAAFAATLLPQAELERMRIPVNTKYVSSHDSVYLSVARGLFAAGGGIPRTFENLDPALRDQLRVLWSTPGYTPHAVAAHPRVPGETVERLRAAMAEMADAPQGAALLEAIGFRGLVPALDTDYDDIRRLGIKLLDR